MKEIGGFLEWETYSGAEYHQEALALNSARNALRFLLRARKIRSIWLPRLLCEVIEEACRAENVEIRYYPPHYYLYFQLPQLSFQLSRLL